MMIICIDRYPGIEDFFGDMDFKVTGTHEGITAIQMDIKIHGLTRPIVEEAIRRTREARLFIMEVMKGNRRAAKRSWQICTEDHQIRLIRRRSVM